MICRVTSVGGTQEGVAHLADAGQHVTPELHVAVDLGVGAAHAHVALVDTQGARPASFTITWLRVREKGKGKGWGKGSVRGRLGHRDRV